MACPVGPVAGLCGQYVGCVGWAEVKLQMITLSLRLYYYACSAISHQPRPSLPIAALCALSQMSYPVRSLMNQRVSAGCALYRVAQYADGGAGRVSSGAEGGGRGGKSDGANTRCPQTFLWQSSADPLDPGENAG